MKLKTVILILFSLTVFSCNKTADYQIINSETALNFLKNNKDVVFIDNRPIHKVKRLGRIKGAIVLPFFSPGTPENIMTKANLVKAAKNKKIVFYCSGKLRAYWATRTAIERWGFKKKQIFWYKAGFNRWIKKKYPIVK